MSLLAVAGANSAVAGGYNIDNSLKFERGNTEWMGQVITTTTNRKTFTFSAWVKRTDLDATDNFGHMIWTGGVAGSNIPVYLRFDGNASYKDKIRLDIGYNGSTFFTLRTDAVYRDTSAWYHIVLAVDTSQATDTNRVKLYVNGTQATLSGSYPTLNFDTQNNYTQSSSSVWALGAYYGGSYAKANMYLAEVHHIDGSQLAPTDFGEFDEDTGIWKPKAYTGSYGTNGFYLDFESSGSLGADGSGNGNNFTLTNITSADQATDTPTNIFCNFQTPVWLPNGTSVTITEGATKAVTSVNEQKGQGNMGVANGKWYFEMQVPSGESSSDFAVGFGEPNLWYGANPIVVGDSNGYSFGVYNSGTWRYNGTTTSTDAVSYAVGDIVMFAMDSDNGKAYMGKNGTWAGSSNPATGSGGFDWDANVTNLSTGDMLIPVFRLAYLSGNDLYSNWGGYTVMSIASGNSDANGYGNFEYAPPTGYYALCSKNLAEFG